MSRRLARNSGAAVGGFKGVGDLVGEGGFGSVSVVARTRHQSRKLERKPCCTAAMGTVAEQPAQPLRWVVRAAAARSAWNCTKRHKPPEPGRVLNGSGAAIGCFDGVVEPGAIPGLALASCGVQQWSGEHKNRDGATASNRSLPRGAPARGSPRCPACASPRRWLRG